jgi:hypothetical protein
MSVQQFGRALGILGTIFLAHSAYSTYERKKIILEIVYIQLELKAYNVDLAYVKAVDEADTSVPIEVSVTNEDFHFHTLTNKINKKITIDSNGMFNIRVCSTFRGCVISRNI